MFSVTVATALDGAASGWPVVCRPEAYTTGGNAMTVQLPAHLSDYDPAVRN
ncbi:MAG: hypothetical protein JO045_07535 [Mycobacterium sp.]|nr:hypothetical protein [Mycobacterium sp.]